MLPFSKKKAKAKKEKTSKKDKKEKSEEKKRQKKLREEQEKREKKLKKEKKKKRKQHERVVSYHEYEIDEHVTPIQFQPDLQFSPGTYKDKKNVKIINNYSETPEHSFQPAMSQKIPAMQLPAPKAKLNRKHIQSQSTPSVLPAGAAIFEGKEKDEYSSNISHNGSYQPPTIETNHTSSTVQTQNTFVEHSPNDKSRNSGKYDMDDSPFAHDAHSKPPRRASRKFATREPSEQSRNSMISKNDTMISINSDHSHLNGNAPHSQINGNGNHHHHHGHHHHHRPSHSRQSKGSSRTSISRSSQQSRSSVSVSSSGSGANELMGHIQHISQQMSNGGMEDLQSMVHQLGASKGRRLSLDQQMNTTPTPDPPLRAKRSKHQYNETYDNLSVSDLHKKRKSAKLQNRRTSAIVGHHLTLLAAHNKQANGGSASISAQSAGNLDLKVRRRSSSKKLSHSANTNNTNSTQKTDSTSGDGFKLPINTIISSQQRHREQTKQKRKQKEFRIRTHRNSGSSSINHSLSAADIHANYVAMGKSNSARVASKTDDEKHSDLNIVSNAATKRYTDRLKKKEVKAISSSTLFGRSKGTEVFGGGYGVDSKGIDEPNVPGHLRAYYAIQQDLQNLKQATKKKPVKTQLDAINTKLHTLFFANERTNLPNLAAFQKFFIDRMSVRSVHKDLDWHICLLRPKIHSRLQHTQIDGVITVVSDLLRKCVKKFNNKRGHLISAANTHRIGVGTYGGGKDKNQIQSAFILSQKANSVPPEMGSPKQFTAKLPYQLQAGTPSESAGLHHNFLDLNVNPLAGMGDSTESYEPPSPSPYASDSEQSVKSANGHGSGLLNTYDVMTPPASVQFKQETKKKKKERNKHNRLLSFSKKKRESKSNKHTKHHKGLESKPNMSTQEIVALTGLPGQKKAKGSDHHNVDEPYPMELFHVSDTDFVLVYYVKFLTKWEQIMVEFLSLYQQYSMLSDDMESDIPLQLSLVASNPRQTYLESIVRAQNTIQWGRQSREHPWIKVQTDKRKSQKFGQDLCFVVKYMQSNDIDSLHELMKQAPDLNTVDRETGKTVLELALEKSIKQPSFAWVARYLALKQLLFSQRLQDESIILQALETNNPMVAEILLHLDPELDSKNAQHKTCLDLALHANYRNLARYMIKLNIPSWHNQQLIRRWNSACSTGDVVKLRSVLQRGFNIDYFATDTQQTALIICAEKGYKECVEFLLKQRANVDAQDNKQRTALHYAAINLDGEILRLILESRANWSLRDLEGKTAMKYVYEKIGFVPRKRPEDHMASTSLNSLQQKRPTALLVRAESTRFRGGSSMNQDTNHYTYRERSSQAMRAAAAPKKDMYSESRNKFWKVDDNDDDIDSNASWDEFGYLVDCIQPDDKDNEEDEDENDEEEEEEKKSRDGDHELNNVNSDKVKYEDVDNQQVVKIFDVACQAGIPLDSRLLLLAVQRDWPHVVLVLCQAKAKLDVDVTGKDGITPLMLAAREGKNACLSALLQSGHPDLDKADSADRTPIMHAAYRGESECVSRLLKAGASIDVETVDGTTLLMAACYGGLDEFAKYLIEKGADLDAVNENGFNALLFASSEGYQEVVSLLLNNNASINVVSRAGLTPLMAGCSGGLHELVLYVLGRINRKDMDETDENGWTALMHAVASGSEKCAAILLKAGASVVTVGEDGYSLLFVAICGNLIWMVRHILDVIRKQITIETKRKIYHMFNTHETGSGFSAIHEACGTGADKCLSLLLQYNEQYFDGNMIRFDMPDLNGRTPLMIACLNRHIECVKLLLDNRQSNVDVNKRDHGRNSVLVYAIESGDVSIVRLLIRHPSHRAKYDQATLEQARVAAEQRENTEMLALLDNINIASTHTSPKHSTRSRPASMNGYPDDEAPSADNDDSRDAEQDDDEEEGSDEQDASEQDEEEASRSATQTRSQTQSVDPEEEEEESDSRVTHSDDEEEDDVSDEYR